MPLLTGLLILLLFQCLGEATKTYFELNVPGAVIGMALLFVGLCIRGTAPSALIKASQSLIPLLGLMFLPASTGLFFLGTAFNNQWTAILCAIILGSILSLLFNGVVVKWLSRHHEL